MRSVCKSPDCMLSIDSRNGHFVLHTKAGLFPKSTSETVLLPSSHKCPRTHNSHNCMFLMPSSLRAMGCGSHPRHRNCICHQRLRAPSLSVRLSRKSPVFSGPLVAQTESNRILSLLHKSQRCRFLVVATANLAFSSNSVLGKRWLLCEFGWGLRASEKLLSCRCYTKCHFPAVAKPKSRTILSGTQCERSPPKYYRGEACTCHDK
mmetsp:Transcript_114159/g.179722  ORF Transcript_114159/g.179722 Transcript_114159/m.179722 type:complete len:206 (+) Transcript_114159:203-820(+)